MQFIPLKQSSIFSISLQCHTILQMQIICKFTAQERNISCYYIKHILVETVIRFKSLEWVKYFKILQF